MARAKRTVEPTTSGLAVAALVSGIIGLVFSLIPFFGFLFGLAPLVLGIFGLREVRREGKDGKGMAVTGIVLGSVGIVLCIITTLALLAVLVVFNGLLTTPLDMIPIE